MRAGDLLPNPDNWRTHPAAQRSALQGLLEEVGFVGTVLGRETPAGIMLLDGHLRSELAPDTMITVALLDDDVTDEEAQKILLTYDPVAAMASAERKNLEKLLASVQTESAGVAEMLERLANQHRLGAGKAGNTDPDQLPQAVPAITEPGDVWILGEHRLMCGDSTKAEDVGRLMRGAPGQAVPGQAAALVFTDPPYGVDYASRFEAMANDALTRDALAMFLTEAFRNMAAWMADGAGAYIWHASSTREDYAYAMKAAGLQEHQYLIWVKGSLVLGHADYQWQHEPCFYASRDGDAPLFYGDRTQTTVWQIAAAAAEGPRTIALGQGLLLSDGAGHELYVTPNAPKNKKLRNVRVAEDEEVQLLTEAGQTDTWQVRRDTASPEHPTQKPVELAERALQNSSRPGDVVLDLFMGSGTTLIAAERLGRRCRGMELDPRYVDVAVRRWEEFTGLEATREKKSEDSPA